MSQKGFIMQKIIVHLGKRSYPIFIGVKLQDIGKYLKNRNNSRKVFVITNPLVKRLYFSRLNKSLLSSGFEVHLCIIPDGETYKNLDTVKEMYLRALKSKLDRNSSVIALGGGVIGDIAGFFAATYLRGLPLIQIPTTLLAMVDSSVGGKTGVDLAQGKNLVGSFYQPNLVWIDTSTLNTLDLRQIKNGLSEVIKYGIIKDSKFFDYLERILSSNAINYKEHENIVHKCCLVKAKVVQEDEFEKKGVREILNFGHTFGHALETLTKYRYYLHGEAVAIGMNIAALAAEKLKILDTHEQSRISDLIRIAGLPLVFKMKLSYESLLNVMLRDKKVRNGKMRFVLPVKIGKVKVFSDIPVNVIKEVLKSL